MKRDLIIVESPTKARTLNRYLGKEFKIMASMGHVKDLPEKRLGVDIKNGFSPKYVIIKGKQKILNEIKKASKDATTIYLGPDPDREGEAIAWHIAEEIGNHKKQIWRVLFNEFTSKAIKEALNFPQSLNRKRFESQLARRILDRLVGYQISPLLWNKMKKKNLSAGRVQSVALRMICDREKEIQSFIPKEYWKIWAHLKPGKEHSFKARLILYKEKKVELENESQVRELISQIEGKDFSVLKIEKKRRKRNPPPPFITSLMQQEAFKRLNFPAKKTMQIAQSLYEGVELGKMGLVGLITYMRTDSYRISNEALSWVRDLISDRYGKEYLPQRPNQFKSPKGAQEAHEAIRPTSPELYPESVKPFLTKDQFRLYQLIWNRFVASQMMPTQFEQLQVDIIAGDAIFRATGNTLIFNGYLVVWEEEEYDEHKSEDQQGLPPLKEGQKLELSKLEPTQHFTQPPPRYSEATLIKALEENGIGRPSTYATILANIRNREYVRTVKGRFRPTELGLFVSDMLVKNFPEIFDIEFTAKMESELDRIERGEVKWTEVLANFYNSFSKGLNRAKRLMKGEIPIDLRCPECGRELLIKSGKNGLFVGCSGFPECRYTSNFERDKEGNIRLIKRQEPEKTDQICEKCGRPMVIQKGRYGQFLACSGYPECKNTKKLGSSSKLDIPCPIEGCNGKIVIRWTKNKRRFYGCSNYPKCKFMIWNEPYPGKCPKCGKSPLIIKRSKGKEPQVRCIDPKCSYSMPLPSSEGN